MKNWLALTVGIAFVMVSGGVRADDADTAHELIANSCSNCHGKTGESTGPTFPRLAGQTEEYIEAQLKAFRDKTRADPHAQAYMWGMAGNPKMTDGVIEEISKFFSKQTPVKGDPAADTMLSDKGKQLFLHGAAERGVPECAQCHGDKAAGKDTIPRLAGQRKEYLASQLEAFQLNTRENPLMHENASKLTVEDIDALSTYLASQ